MRTTPACACCRCCSACSGGVWRAGPDLPGDDALSARITEHAGAGLLSGVSSHLLVATHTFLEMLHYGVWVLAIPLVGLKTRLLEAA